MTDTTTPVSEGESMLSLYRRVCGEILKTLRDLPDEALNWQPPVPESNSIYAIVYHATSSANWWLHAAQGNFIERDRPSEFSSQGTRALLEEGLTSWLQTAEQVLLSLSPADYENAYVVPGSPSTTRSGGKRTARWSLLHILEHLAIHQGHIEITRQWYEREHRAESIH